MRKPGQTVAGVCFDGASSQSFDRRKDIDAIRMQAAPKRRKRKRRPKWPPLSLTKAPTLPRRKTLAIGNTPALGVRTKKPLKLKQIRAVPGKAGPVFL